MKKYLLAFLGGYVSDETEENDANDKRELLNIVHCAKEEWLAAQNYFENVSDPELVDYAIYKLEAARRKYMYLLKQAKIEGLADNQVVHQLNRADLS